MPPPNPAPSAPTAADSIAPDRETVAVIQHAILDWFSEHGRDLPWRHTRDPWAILVSEIMLQQIQVVRAIPFYHAFLQRFPTVHDLAAARLADAIRVWGDLGHYKRVVSLHCTARIIVAEHGGTIPADPDVLRSFPGIGPYTAGAVACFAFERDVPFLDTNVRRVLHRLFVGPDRPAPTAPDRALLALAADVLPPGQGWAWNQALIEFGALHCTARRPACVVCPLRSRCRAYPEIEPAIGANRVAASRPPSYRYEGSNRYYRGRVLARLREPAVEAAADQGIPLSMLAQEVRLNLGESDWALLATAVTSLERDGLIVAEERPIYRATDDPAPGETELHVRLP